MSSEIEEKLCGQCKNIKPVTDFYAHWRKGYQDKCKASYNRIHYLNNAKTYKSNASKRRSNPGYKNARLKNRYGAKETYEEILTSQGEVCDICKTPPEEDDIRFCLDHSHKTGVARGLLCRACNSGLGYFKDNTDNLSSAIKYLKKHEKE